MHSKPGMALLGFGTIFLSFGGVTLVIALLGVRYGSREVMGGAGGVALGFLVVGAILAAGGLMVDRGRRKHGAAST